MTPSYTTIFIATGLAAVFIAAKEASPRLFGVKETVVVKADFIQPKREVYIAKADYVSQFSLLKHKLYYDRLTADTGGVTEIKEVLTECSMPGRKRMSDGNCWRPSTWRKLHK